MNKIQLYQTNLCKEILITAQQMQCTLDTMSFDYGVFYAPYIPETMTKPKYKFSRAKWYEAEYKDCYYDEVRAWCTEQFGPQPDVADAWTRWHHKYHNTVFFRDQKDYNWFVLRWGG
jgi:hypothetical protein